MKKISVIKNGIRKEALYSKTHARTFLEKNNPEIISAIGKTKASDLIWLGSVGELHHIKGFEYSISAISLLKKELEKTDPKKKVIYTIIGSGEEHDKLEAQIKKLGLENNVLLLGHIKDVREYMKAFDIMIIPSLSEGLCYVAIESGHASLPVVATAVGGIPEIIDDMKSGILVQPRRERDIYHALLFLTKHESVQNEQAKALHEKTVKNFSVEEMVNETEKIYSK